MPGTPATSPRLGIPRYANTDAADFATDVNAVVDAVDASIALVTTLPGSPRDGQEIFFVADATAGVVWRFRYRAASASSHKWEFVGGPAIRVIDLTPRSQTSGSANTWAAPNTANQIVIPFAGDYDFDLTGTITVTSGSASTIVAGVAAASAPATVVGQSGAQVTGTPTQLVAPGGDFGAGGVAAVAITPVFSFGLAAVTYTASNIYLTAKPIRIG